MIIKKRGIFVFLYGLLMALALPILSFGAEKIERYIPDTQAAEQGMTLWQTIQAGGGVMIVLAFLSVAAVALIIYYFIEIKQEKLIPQVFVDEVVTLVEKGREEEARKKCVNSENFPSRVLLAGLARKGREKVVVKEAMADEGRRSVDNLWQKLTYLADIAVISPMVGLLGTVLGMIQAFNVIAFQAGAVKPILLASGIAKAMVTTASGLIIAIPAMIFHAYFRGKVQNIAAQLENVSEELYHLLTD
ncbi:MAG: hypothetical protein GF408_04510 [Candidatus Omnitrophica bacterium]|nr:hypothetical protein [Candidatus Omnitrophota bacterium]